MKKLIEIIQEGSWGYDPQESDAALDHRSDLTLKLLETIYDDAFKYVHSNDEGIEINGNSGWVAVSVIEFYFEELTALFHLNINNKEYEKYYYWWKLKEYKKKDIIDLYSDAIQLVAEDQNFINSWKSPEKLKRSLSVRADKLKKYAKLRDEYSQYLLDLNKDKLEADIKHIKNPENTVVCYGKSKKGKGKLKWQCIDVPSK